MRRMLLVVWVLAGFFLLPGADQPPAPRSRPGPAQPAQGKKPGSAVLAMVLGSVGVALLLILPGTVISVADKPGTQEYYAAASQALPTLLVAAALGYLGIVRIFGAAFGRPGHLAGPWRALSIHLRLWVGG